MSRLHRLRILIAVGALANGAIHLRLLLDDYGGDDIRRSFVLNVIASVLAAVVVLVWAHPLALLAPLAVANGTLLGFALARTGDGIMGIQERGWEPRPDAAWSVAVEIATAVLCVAALALGSPRQPTTAPTGDASTS